MRRALDAIVSQVAGPVHTSFAARVETGER